jgi:hypothetical protein
MTSINKTNEYSASIRRLPEERLREYIEKPDDFHDEAVLAAIWELGKRRASEAEEIRLETEINNRTFSFREDHPKVLVPEIKLINPEVPNLYSMRSIQIFSVLFSVIAGGILMAINFNRITQKIEALKVIGFSFAYTILSFTIFSILGTQSPFLTIILNLLGAFLIDMLFWKRVLGSEFRYNTQQIWTALIIAMLLISPIVYYVIKSGLMESL